MWGPFLYSSSVVQIPFAKNCINDLFTQKVHNQEISKLNIN